MSFRNSTETRMYNFANKDYLNLLSDIILYFKNKECFGFDDTAIRYDQETQSYVASVYLLDAEEE